MTDNCLILNSLKKIIFILASLIWCSNVLAQKENLIVSGLAQDIALFNKYAAKEKPSPSELEVYNYVQNTIQNLIENGYLASSLDSFYAKDTKWEAKIFVGNKYKWAGIKTVQIPSVMLANIGYEANTFNGKIIDLKTYTAFCKKALEYAENNGYPFATMQLKNMEIQDSLVKGDITFTKNKVIYIDSIIIEGDAEMGYNYVKRFFDIAEGDLYNESKLRDISKRIQSSVFLMEAQPWVITFGANNTKLNLFLNQKNANRADAVIGFLPNNSQLGGKLLVTGDVKLNLVNSLNKGEQLNLNWQNLQYKSPRLLVDLSVPYILGSAFGFTSKFNYTKNDSSFRTLLGEIGIQYVIDYSKFIKVFYTNNSSRLLSVNTFELASNRSLPPNVDYNSKTFGIAWVQNKLNNRLNPSKGYTLTAEFGAGIKNIITNNLISEAIDPVLNIPFKYLYDSLKPKTYKYQATIQGSYFFAVTKALNVKTAYNGGIIYNDKLFKNELFQIGGYKILRGFDEASLFVNQYHVVTVEPHYSISRNSYFLLLVDAAKINLPYVIDGIMKTGFAIGAGLNLETKGGAFSLVYAVSNNLGNQLELRNGKIHFGYINSF
jgi:outer membrane protein assembly factor BamA